MWDYNKKNMTPDCEELMTDQNALEQATRTQELQGLRAIKSLQESLGNLLEETKPYDVICRTLHEVTNMAHVGLLIINDENAQLETRGQFPAGQDTTTFALKLFNPEPDSAAAQLLKGEIAYVNIEDANSADTPTHALIPLLHGGTLIAAIMANLEPEQKTLEKDTQLILWAVAPSLIINLQQLHQHQQMRDQLEEIRRESNIFRQIDDELSDIIEIEYVFRMIMDWALRFSNADAAGLSLYDAETDTLRLMAQYGYREGAMTTGNEIQKLQRGITYRVARSGQAEIVPDVTHDKDYYSVADGIQTQMTVPIMREEQVIAVIALESRKLNGFEDEHLAFVQKLTNRAGVAVDNARLFTETRREREKLSHIVRNIADIVIVIGLDERIVVMNYSALLGFMLAIDGEYTGKYLFDVISHKKLQTAYREATESGENVDTELDLPNKRTYHARISLHEGVGRIIVMQDITYFKETDKLKTELIATVSHDLKQPLSVMRGYLDLLEMSNEFDDRSQRYVNSLEHSFSNMRRLIDDLLDIAHIESGLQMNLEQINIADLLRRCIFNNNPMADNKAISVSLELPNALPKINGDESRLEQVFNNLINNAIKYTPPGGIVKVYLEVKQNVVRIFVEDNGLGIGPEDQSQIFARFYRVRRPETESIEGTGLGLAIVKSLVEAHQGKIDLKSELGVGSTFRVTLPT